MISGRKLLKNTLKKGNLAKSRYTEQIVACSTPQKTLCDTTKVFECYLPTKLHTKKPDGKTHTATYGKTDNLTFCITMKKTIIIIMLSAITLTASAQESLFKKYEDAKGVETVYISKALLALASGYMNVGDMNIKSITQKIESIRLLNCKDRVTAQKLKADAIAEFKKGKYEEMLRHKDNSERTYIYMKKAGRFNEFVLLNIESEVVQVINITGTMTIEDIQRITR